MGVSTVTVICNSVVEWVTGRQTNRTVVSIIKRTNGFPKLKVYTKENEKSKLKQQGTEENAFFFVLFNFLHLLFYEEARKSDYNFSVAFFF